MAVSGLDLDCFYVNNNRHQLFTHQTSHRINCQSITKRHGIETRASQATATQKVCQSTIHKSKYRNIPMPTLIQANQCRSKQHMTARESASNSSGWHHFHPTGARAVVPHRYIITCNHSMNGNICNQRGCHEYPPAVMGCQYISNAFH